MSKLIKDFSTVIIKGCPGGPDPGCCEFCPGPCQNLYWPDGTVLTEEEEEEGYYIIYKDEYEDEDEENLDADEAEVIC